MLAYFGSVSMLRISKREKGYSGETGYKKTGGCSCRSQHGDGRVKLGHLETLKDAQKTQIKRRNKKATHSKPQQEPRGVSLF